MMQTKLITTVHWNVPQEFKDYIDSNKDNHFLVFGGGKNRLESLNDKWLLENCIPDDARQDNISKLNPYLNEQTSIYLAFKNMDLLPSATDAIGHAHYRRFFNRAALMEMQFCDAIVANPTSLNVAGFGCTLEKQYELCHVKEDFQILKHTIEEEGLMDEAVWWWWTHLNYLYAPCNIFCMAKSWFLKYCNDLFKVALKLPTRIDVSGRDDYQRRACSFLCERFTSYWFYLHDFRHMMKIVQKPCQFHPEWKATNSFDVRGCYNGEFKHDNSLDVVANWVANGAK